MSDACSYAGRESIILMIPITQNIVCAEMKQL